MKNIALILSYNGEKYHGWQIQNNAVSVCSVLTDAIEKIIKKKVSVTGCGRTDAGVHAINYVCNFMADTNIPEEKIPCALNSVLPYDIRVKKAFFISSDFHSRFDVIKKRYVYKIVCDGVGDVFSLGRAWQIKYDLDFEKMQSACKAFLGEHDFAAFRATGTDTKTSVRTIYDLHLEKEGNVITVSVCANGFLYNMVRIIVGTLMYVGCGKIEASEISDIIKSLDRTRAGITAPPDGLYMHSVEYDKKFGIEV